MADLVERLREAAKFGGYYAAAADEIERLNNELTASIDREWKMAVAGERVALRLAEFIKAASAANILLGENDLAWPDYAEGAWNILARVLDSEKSVGATTEKAGG